jgi:hypothetical protein
VSIFLLDLFHELKSFGISMTLARHSVASLSCFLLWGHCSMILGRSFVVYLFVCFFLRLFVFRLNVYWFCCFGVLVFLPFLSSFVLCRRVVVSLPVCFLVRLGSFGRRSNLAWRTARSD